MKTYKHLEGLNTLRFFAAALVLVRHCTVNLLELKIPVWEGGFNGEGSGTLAVEFFFVLSGFLLTFLANKEFDKTGKIDVKQFFLRRVLRIFPLYYFAVFLGFILLGVLYPMLKHTAYFSFPISEGLTYYLLFFPNYVLAHWSEGVGALSSLWSIGVEEQFYLMFPFLMAFFLTGKNSLLKISGILIAFSLFYAAVDLHYIPMSETGVRFVYMLKFHYMWLGALFAQIIYTSKENSWIFKVIQNKAFQLFIWLLTFIILFIDKKELDHFHIISSITFCFLILIVINKENRLFNIEVKPFTYLGSISFGIYVYHAYVSYILRFILEKSAGLMQIITSFPITYYAIELGLTILVATLSYNYYESFFLRIKDKLNA